MSAKDIGSVMEWVNLHKNIDNPKSVEYFETFYNKFYIYLVIYSSIEVNFLITCTKAIRMD